LREFGWVEGS